MKKAIFIAILTIVFMAGCAGKSTYNPPEGCIDAHGNVKQSVILEHIDHPAETAIALKLATGTAVQQATPAHIKEAIKIIGITHSMLEDSSYSGVAGFLIQEITGLESEYSAQLMIVTQYAQDMVDIDLPIYECDKVLLKKHFREQIRLLRGVLRGTDA